MFILKLALMSSLLIGLLYIIIRPTSSLSRSDAISIVCSTSIIADTVKQIGAHKVTVHTLMGPGVDPHTYRAKESDVHYIAQADVIFYNGLHLEGKMAHMFQHLASRQHVVPVAEAIAKHDLLMTSQDGVHDPHIWHNVRLWIHVARCICDTLSSVDPEHAWQYQTRGKEYIHQLETLDQWIRSSIEQIEPTRRILITAHDAFGYFGKEYGLRVEGLQGISTDAEISVYDIASLTDTIITHGIKSIFVESSIPKKSLIAVQHAVRARGREVALGDELYSDALGDPSSPAGTYIGMIHHNVSSIVHGLY